ncbi:restriction endonuclease subunit S [Endozoicomonas sp. SESOKO1]|uniref:restriction endonuclease subunit S n=1 Tax=Endozoicomonas sp. SESOKO1 TaxID=2828742 RepID=UPI002149310D|nr:restriction endonuclease subunit S [Endozoicomonas sp. SESOKO1]
MSWAVRRMDEVAELSLGKMLDEKKNKGEPLPYLANLNVRWGEFDLKDLRTMRFEGHELERFSIRAGDIIMCEGGEPGRCALWKEEQSLMIQKALHRIRPKPAINSTFLYYSLLNIGKSGGFTPYFTGSTIKHLPKQQLAQVEIRIPKEETQNQIAAVLCEYDNLIKNNRRRIVLLEESARLLYQEWFVHLRFPGHEHVKITDGVPEGWYRITLSELCQQKKKIVKPESFGVDTPYIGLEHMPRRSITLNLWENSAKVNSNKYWFDQGDILFGKIRPYFHKIGFTLCSGITSSDAIVIQAKSKELYSFTLMYLSSDFFISLASKTVREGSKMPRADWKYLTKTSLLLPDKRLLLQFDEQIQGILKQLSTLSKFNQNLANARDLLLPRLMNGELTP